MNEERLSQLMELAKKSGQEDTEWVSEALHEAFSSWMDTEELEREMLTDQEYVRLYLDFEEGFGLCQH